MFSVKFAIFSVQCLVLDVPHLVCSVQCEMCYIFGAEFPGIRNIFTVQCSVFNRPGVAGAVL